MCLKQCSPLSPVPTTGTAGGLGESQPPLIPAQTLDPASLRSASARPLPQADRSIFTARRALGPPGRGAPAQRPEWVSGPTAGAVLTYSGLQGTVFSPPHSPTLDGQSWEGGSKLEVEGARQRQGPARGSVTAASHPALSRGFLTVWTELLRTLCCRWSGEAGGHRDCSTAALSEARAAGTSIFTTTAPGTDASPWAPSWNMSSIQDKGIYMH